MRRFVLWTTVLLFTVQGNAKQESVKLTISPASAVRNPGSNLTVTCKSDVPLVGCSFRVWYTEIGGTSKLHRDYPVMDFDRGKDSDGVSASKFDRGSVLYNAVYFGKGLSERECGVSFTPLSQGRYLLACRGRAPTGDWGYNFVSLQVGYGRQPEKRNDPRGEIAVVAPKQGEARILHEAKQNQVLRECIFFLSRNSEIVSVNRTNNRSRWPGNYEAHLSDTECSLTLKQVTGRDNGVLWYLVASNESLNSYLYFKTIVVAKAPRADQVSLALDPKGPYAPGDRLTATCQAPGSRPACNMSWFFGDEEINRESVEVVNDADWRWPWDLKSVTQSVTKTLGSADNDKKLTCLVKHSTLSKDMMESVQIVVQGGGEWAVTGRPSSFITVVLSLTLAVLVVTCVVHARIASKCCCARPGQELGYSHTPLVGIEPRTGGGSTTL